MRVKETESLKIHVCVQMCVCVCLFVYIQRHQVVWFFKFSLTIGSFCQYVSQGILAKEFKAFEILAKVVIVKSDFQSFVLEEIIVNR